MSDRIIHQIRRAHASARPKDANPAWQNTHRDLGYVLAEIESQDKEIEHLKAEVGHWKGMTKGRESEIDQRQSEIAVLQAELKQVNAVVERVSKLPDEWMWKAQSENGPATVKMMSILAGQLNKALAALETDDG